MVSDRSKIAAAIAVMVASLGGAALVVSSDDPVYVDGELTSMMFHFQVTNDTIYVIGDEGFQVNGTRNLTLTMTSSVVDSTWNFIILHAEAKERRNAPSEAARSDLRGYGEMRVTVSEPGYYFFIGERDARETAEDHVIVTFSSR